MAMFRNLYKLKNPERSSIDLGKTSQSGKDVGIGSSPSRKSNIPHLPKASRVAAQ